MIVAVHAKLNPKNPNRPNGALEALYVDESMPVETLARLIVEKNFEGLIIGAMSIEDSDDGVTIRLPNLSARTAIAFADIIRIYRPSSEDEERYRRNRAPWRLVVGKAPS